MRAGLLIVPWILVVGCGSSSPVREIPTPTVTLAPSQTAHPTSTPDAAPSPVAPRSPAAPTATPSTPAAATPAPATPAPKPAWRKTAPMPREREGFDAVLLGDGTVLVVGNDGDPWAEDDYYESGAAPGSQLADLYDPATDTWTAVESLNKPRKWGAAVALPDGSAMVLGGVNSDAEPFSSTKVFSPATSHWTSGPVMTMARAYPDAVTLHDGRVLVVGSGAASDGVPAPRDTSEVYDPKIGEWTDQTPLPRRGTQVDHLVRLGNSGALALGGYETGDTDSFGDVGFVYGAASNRWKQVRFPWVFEPSLITLPDGDVLAVGGNGGGDCCRGIASVKDVHRFDHKTLRWREVASLPTPREAIALAVLPDGRVLAAGGIRVRGSDDGSDGTPVRVTDLYDPATDTWSRGPKLRERGGGAIAVVLADGDVLLLGGSFTVPERLTVRP